MGACFVNPIFKVNWDRPNKNSGLTIEEKNILYHLLQAWENFKTLDNKHPDDNNEFLKAIHEAQKSLALRVARRIDEDVWIQP
jgi:hypothetical protein